MRPLLTALAVCVFLSHGAVFVLFFIHSGRIGGDAFQGGEEGGRFFVANHGKRTEVSREEYDRSRLLGIAIFAGAPLGLAGIGWLLFAEFLPRVIFLRGAEERAAAVKRVLRSGPAVAEGRIGGRLGWANFGGPMIRVSVHPGGVHLKPFGIPAFAVERERIRAVEERKSRFRPRVEILHESRDVRSPLLLDAAWGTPLAAAIAELAAGSG